MIRRIEKEELPLCLDFIHLCFSTVAEMFGFTKENTPGHNAFMPFEKLENFWNWDFLSKIKMKKMNWLDIFLSARIRKKKETYVLHNLCVKPQKRKQGYGKQLLDFAKEKVRELGGKILFLDFINDYTELKEWYFKNGFEFKGTVKYEHLPFTVGFAECKLK